MTRLWLVRVILGHQRVVAALIVGLAAYPLLPHSLGPATRSVMAWDIAAIVLLAMAARVFYRQGNDEAMSQNAKRQEDGEWTMFCVTLLGVGFSFVALTHELQNAHELSKAARSLHVGLVASTLLLSWLMTHIVFAFRYAHEYYSTAEGAGAVDGGLEFPGKESPDYWDFVYFALVLGMTFQVSDVQITSRKLRRLATVHGLIGFLFNTVIVALTVNIAASLL